MPEARIERKIGKLTIIVEDFKTPFSIMNRPLFKLIKGI